MTSHPTARGAWTAREAAHLARRAGFGATPTELARLVELGRAGAVREFTEYPEVDEELEARIAHTGDTLANVESENVFEMAERAREWWLFRMASGNHPLQEKLALLWHDHFACQFSKLLRGPLYFGQNAMFRRLGSSSFRDLLRGVASDPAMLVFLDNRVNKKDNPNENWGRELLELFTLGVDRYSQTDVYEAARIFTGWSTPTKNTAEFIFNADDHDEGDKVLLGETIQGRAGDTGIEEGWEALDIILKREDCATFIASKLYLWFVSHEPHADRIEELALVLRKNGLSIREALRSMFNADWFYGEDVMLSRYKNPVEWVISAVRLLGMQNTYLLNLRDAVRVTGMNLFEPPSVAGWDHGTAWINSGTIVSRFNLALQLSEVPNSRRQVAGRAAMNLGALAPEPANGGENLGGMVEALATRLLQEPLPAASKEAVAQALEDEASFLPTDMEPRKRHRALTRAAIHLLLVSPEFALC